MSEDEEHDEAFEQLLRRVARTPDVSGVRRDVEPSSELAGRFVVERKLSQGATGRVFAAFDRLRQETVALKMLGILTPRSIASIKREFRVAAELVHPHLVRLHELFSDGADWFFTMDLLEGTTIDRLRQDPRARRLDVARRIFSELAHGLLALHQSGALHGDLKPSNFLLVGAEQRVVLLDFGLARTLDSATQEHPFAGTPEYMAPEQALGQQLTEAADWYSFGVVLFEFFTGTLPPKSGALELSALPLELRPLCAHLLEEDPAKRPDADAVFAALGASVLDAPPASSTTRPPPPPGKLIGRHAELARLHEAYERSRRGAAVVVLVRGESGIGKTTLVRHFLDGLARDGATVLTGRCRERESVSYKAVDGLVEDLVQYLDDQPQALVTALLPPHIAELTRLFPTLRAAAAVAHAPRPSPDVLDQTLLKQRAVAAFRELLAALAARAPLVLWIDDLQWSDAHSAALIEPLLRAPSAVPLLLVGCVRGGTSLRGAMIEALFGDAELAEPSWIDMPPLARGEAEALAASLLEGSDESSLDVAREVAAEGAGHPLFITELAHWHTARGSAPPRAHRETLSELIRERVRALPHDARELLETTALAGGPLPRSVARRARSLSPNQIERALDVLRFNRLAVTHALDAERLLDVPHDRIREVVTQSLPGEARKEQHRALARAFEAERGTNPEVLATHFEAAGERREAGRYWIEAAHAAFEALAFVYAAELYQRGAALGELEPEAYKRARVREAEALAYAGRALDAAQVYLESAPAHARLEAIELQRRAAEQLLLAGHLERGLAVIETVLRALRMRKTRGGQRVIVSILLGRLRVRLRGLSFQPREPAQISVRELTRVDASWSVACSLGVIDFMRGADFQNEHLLLALRAGDPRRLLRALTLEISYTATKGSRSRPRTERLLELTRQLAARVNDPIATGLMHVSRGVATYLTGMYDEAINACQEAVSILSRYSGTVWETVTAQRFIVASLFQLGRFASLAELVPPLLADAAAKGNLYASTYFRTSYAMNAWLIRDAVDEAREHLACAAREWTAPGVQLTHSWLLIGQCQLALYTGETGALWAAVTAAWPRFIDAQFMRIAVLRLQLWQLRAMAAFAEARAASRRGQHARAAELQRDARSAALRLGRERLPAAEPLSTLLLAAYDAAAGKPERAVAGLERCIAGFEQRAMQAYAAAARARLGALVRGERGASLIAAAHTALTAESVVDVGAMLDVLAPRFATGEPVPS
jgi:hypothetical protein